MDAKKRQEIRAELVSQGYSWDYVDSWPPKTTLYPHRPLLNVDGKVAVERGTPLPNHPGHPDHMARKSRMGLLPWPPGEACKCKACREERETKISEVTGLVASTAETKTAVMGVRGRPRKKARKVGLPRG